MVSPGDLVYIKEGALIQRLGAQEEMYADCIMPGTLISIGTPGRVFEDEFVAEAAMVLVGGRGLYLVVNTELLTADQYADPSRLFPRLTRLRG